MDKNSYNSPLKIRTFEEAAKEEMRYIKGRMDGSIKSLRTGWKKFNQVSMNGIEWGNIITIAGLSGSGKTTMLNELETMLFEYNPEEEFVVLSFNFEMLARRLVGRKLSKHLEKPVKDLYSANIENLKGNITKKEFESAQDYFRTISKITPVYYVDMPGTAEEIEETILKFSKQPDIKGKGILITLDHSILVKKSPKKNQQESLYDLSFTFNKLKKQIKSAFIIVSQLNRSIEDKERKLNPELHFPCKADIFGADALYQYSDMVIVPHRPEMLGISQYGPYGLPVKDIIYMHYLKVRDGEPCFAKMINDLKHNRILEEPPTNKIGWGTGGF